MNRVGFLILVLSIGLWGCQSAPTRVYETKPNRQKETKQVISAQTVLVDARPPFQNAVAHPNGAISLQWDEFTQREAPFEGYLLKDLFAVARRLARLGIGPDSEVLIVGRGKAGEWEEGRLAWTLRRLGVNKVQFGTIDHLNWPSTKNEAPQPPEVPIWKPVEDASLEISKKAALELLRKPQGRVWILDVRPSQDYLRDSDLFARFGLPAPVVNIPWTEFVDPAPQKMQGLKERITIMGISPQDTVLVIDEKGIRSAGATLRLRDMGFSNTTHWTGGYRELRWNLKQTR